MEPEKHPIKRKAGVVPYRRAAKGEIEVLLVTALSHPGSWIFPMGTVEPGETLEQAASRECIEESGCEVDVGPFLAVVDLDKGDKIHRVTFFKGRVVGEIEPLEAGRLRIWVPVEELIELVPEVFRPVAQAFTQVHLD
jgi:ADP-ribose pyrophosphatase YjhB (NUDIX family)